MKKTLRILFLVILTLVLLLVGIVTYLKCTTAPVTQGVLHVEGLKNSVNIYRDPNGVPHVYSQTSDADAFFGLGFVHAQDRFWQMEFQRRVAQGTLSEIFGSKTIDTDKYLRTLGFYKSAKTIWPNLDKHTQEMIESYTAGVNAFIQKNQFPLEFTLLNYKPKAWTVIDSIAWQKVMAWNLQRHSWLNKLNNNFAHAKINEENAGKSLEMHESPDKGSNAWVISGNKTMSGKPLLANDVHLSLSAPGLWYMAEVRGPTLHVTGATIPGSPGVIIGHNDSIAWGVTNGYNDAADLYILDDSEPLTAREEIIKVKGEKEISVTVFESQYGPILNAVVPELEKSYADKTVALKWPALLPGDTTTQAFLDLNYAQNWTQFENALKFFVAPTQTFLYADRAGNIGSYYPGKLPVRHWKSVLPVVPDQAHQWDGFIPFEQLPHAFNPEQGFIASANNQFLSDDYPYSINARWPVPSYRVDRIRELLTTNNALMSVETMMNIQADDMSLIWTQLKPYVSDIQAHIQPEKNALKLLQNWDGQTDRNESAPTVFAYWLVELQTLLSALYPSQNLTPEKKIAVSYYFYRYLNSPMSQSLLQESFRNAVHKLVQEHGTRLNGWRWGNIHQATFVANGFGKINVLNKIWNRHIAASGGDSTVNAGTYDPQTLKQISGATYREIIDLSDFENSVYMIPIGQSGNPFSKHYDDFLETWRDVKYIKIPSAQMCIEGTSECLILKNHSQSK